MSLLNTLFAVVYGLMKSIEGGFSYQVGSYTANGSVIIISMLHTANLVVYWSNFESKFIALFFFAMLVLNYFLFSYRKES